MSAIVNPRDILMQAAPTRINPVTLPPNVIIPGVDPDLSRPPMPTGFSVAAAIANLIITHDNPTFTEGHGYLRTNVYGAVWMGGALPVFADAVKITSFSGSVTSHATNPATAWRLWVTWVSKDGEESLPTGGPNGVYARTGEDVERLVAALTGPGNPFVVLTVPTDIGGVTYPAGTYSAQSFIIDQQVTNAKIKNLAVDDAKIASLGVNKLVAGSLQVGSYISSSNYNSVSGFAIWADGNAVFNNCTMRGTIFANAGLIGGVGINSNGLNSGGYVGYAWPAGGSGGFHLGPNGLLMGNANTGKYIQMTAAGDLYAPGFSLSGGNAYFSGQLQAAGGTFSGALTAGAVNAVNTINLAGQAVTIPLSVDGASGSYVDATFTAGDPVQIFARCPGSWSDNRLTVKINGTTVTFEDATPYTFWNGSQDYGGFLTRYNAILIMFRYVPTFTGYHSIQAVTTPGSSTGVSIFAIQTKR